MRLILLGFLLVIGAPAAAQQQPAPTPNGLGLIDRVVAIVGDTALLQSDVERAIEQARAEGAQIPQDTAQFELFARQILERKVSDLMLVVAARQAAVEVLEEEVAAQVQQRVDQVQRQFGSEIALRNALAQTGLTLDQYRLEIAAQIRDDITARTFIQSRMQYRSRPVIDESDIRQFFENYRTTFGQRPATVSFRQVVIRPRPSREAREAALREAEEVLGELNSGGDFEVLARRFSDDTGTRELGGDLGWFRTGILLPEVERAAFSMSPGQTSGIIESDIGFHIVRLDRARGAERQARQILIRPEIAAADLEAARARADSVATEVRGGASIADLASEFNAAGDQTVVTDAVLDQLPAPYGTALRTAPVGDVLGPIEIPDPQGTRWAVVRLTGRSEAGEFTLDDMRDRIREELQFQSMMQELLVELRDEVYVEILI